MKRLVSGVSVLAAAQLGGQLIGFVMLVLVSRRIGPTYLGAYAVSLNIVTYVGLLTTIGLPVLGMRQISQADVDERRVLVETAVARVFLALTLGAALLAIAPLIANSHASMELLPIVAFKLLTDAVTFDWYLQGTGRHSAVAAARFLGQLAYAIALTPLLASGLVGARHYAIANIFGLAVTAIIMLFLVIHYDGLELAKVPLAALPKRISRSMPFAWWTALTLVYYSTDLILVAYIVGDRQAGLYAAASKMPLSVITVAALWFTVAMPETARLLSRADRDGIRHQTRVAATTAIIVGLPFVLLGPIFAANLVRVVFGSKFVAAGPALAILSASVAVTLVQIVVTSVVMGAGRERPYVRAMSIGAGINVALNLALIPLLGIVGAAISTIVAESIVLIAGLQQLKHVVGRVEVRWRAIGEAAVTTVAASAIALFFLHESGFIIAACSTVIVYAMTVAVRTIRDPRWLNAWLGNTP